MRRIMNPQTDAPKVPIFRPKAGELTQVGIVGREIIFFGQHWDGYCCRECMKEKDTDQCDGCEREWPMRVKGYLDVVRHSSRVRCFLELTVLAAERLTGICGGENQLRGSVVEIGRGNGKKTPLTFCLKAPQVGVHIPEPLDPTPHVKELLNLEPRGSYKRGKKSNPDNGQAAHGLDVFPKEQAG